MLSSEELTVRDLSQAVGLTEKDILDHLVHIERTLQQQGKKLNVSPYKCLACGFVFTDR
ncbi:MAG: transcriptional regulator, partial [Deltaproteobacteria bacterium]|nr:transcriptional regulator [Deltaproteobacteria bacterium]